MTALLFIAFPTQTLAAPVTVPTVVVTPTRTEMLIGQVASSITVITSQEIERKNAETAINLLRGAPGVMVAQNGGQGQTARAFLRGTNSNHVLVLIDGIRVNDPTDPADAFDFSNLPADNIERIEILRGPQSMIYGPDAIGGVIQIFTKKGEGAPKYNAYAEYGRYNSHREGIGASGEIGATLYSVQASYHDTEGFSSFDKKFGGVEKDGSEGYGFSGNVAHKLADNFTAKLATRYQRTDTEFDMLGSMTPDSAVPHNDTRQITGRASGELSLYDGKWTQELGVGLFNVSRFVASGFDYDHHIGTRKSIDWIHRFAFIPRNIITVGLEAWREDYRSLMNAHHALNDKAVYIDDQLTVTDALFVNGGIRLDDHQAFGKQTTWKVGPGYRIRSTGTTLKGTYGTGFKAPSLYQLYSQFYGSTALKPEESRGYDAGFEQMLMGDKVTFGASWFHNDIEELLDVIQLIPFDPFSFRYVNVGKARTQGIESFARFMPSLDWTVAANYTFTKADDLDSDQRLVRRPKHQASLSAAYQATRDLDVSANLRYVGPRIDYDLAFTRARMPSFTTVGVSGNYQINPNVTLYGRVDNLLNKKYEEVYGFGTPGVSLFVGAKTRF